MKFPLKYKAALLILVIVLATSVVATVVSSRIIKNNRQDTFTRQAVHLADTIAVSVDGDQVRASIPRRTPIRRPCSSGPTRPCTRARRK